VLASALRRLAGGKAGEFITGAAPLLRDRRRRLGSVLFYKPGVARAVSSAGVEANVESRRMVGRCVSRFIMRGSQNFMMNWAKTGRAGQSVCFSAGAPISSLASFMVAGRNVSGGAVPKELTKMWARPNARSFACRQMIPHEFIPTPLSPRCGMTSR